MSPQAEGPFHAGERTLHARIGASDAVLAWGSTAIRDHMPAQHQQFFAELGWVVVGGLDASGQPWATAWHGEPGCLQPTSATRLRIGAQAVAGDPLAGCWPVGAPLALLGITPHNGRRNRMNGRVAATHAGGLDVAVLQSFGNCPKHIVRRLWQPAGAGAGAAPLLLGAQLPQAVCGVLCRTDTVFLASASSRASQAGQAGAVGEGVDVSHRGGAPGFLRVHEARGATVIELPDYAGNRLFNTLGNVLTQARVGLLVMSPDSGDLLWLACWAELIDEPACTATFAGAQRVLRLHVLEGRWSRQAWPWRAEA